MYDQIAANKAKSAALIAFFVALVVAVGYVFGRLTAFGYAAPVLAFIVAAGMSLGSYWYSDRLVLGLSHARPVDKDTEPYVVNTVEGLAIAAGLPVPKAYIIEDPAPNAFATGRDPQHAAIALTRGLVEKLDRLELEGVIAHELAHVRNYDIRLQTLTAVLAGTVVLLADWMMRAFWWGGVDSDDDRDGQSQIIFLVVGLIMAVLAPFFALIIQAAVSRRREFLADADGALLSRYPDGLASALRKIAADATPLAAANKATEPLYIANPLKDQRRGRAWNGLFDTHPDIAERIRRLEAM